LGDPRDSEETRRITRWQSVATGSGLVQGGSPVISRNQPAPILLTLQESAASLAIPEFVLHWLIEGGQIPVVEFHRRWRIRSEDLAEFAKTRRVTQPKTCPATLIDDERDLAIDRAIQVRKSSPARFLQST
jgi:hypothetical protein